MHAMVFDFTILLTNHRLRRPRSRPCSLLHQSWRDTSTAVTAVCVQQAASCPLRPGGHQFQPERQSSQLSTKMRYSSLVSALIVSLAQLHFTQARPASVWQFDIWNSPAPPPDEGPPISAGALRDKSKLKYEIIGIVGSYIVWLLGTLFLVLFVGKRLRRKTQTSNQTLNMEIVKPAPLGSHPGTSMAIESPLKSPGKMASLKSWASGGRSHSHKHSNVSLATTIDEKIIEADKARNMDEMAKLYAAVMIHDEERSMRAKESAQTTPRTATFPLTPRSPRTNMTLPQTPRSPPAHMTLPGTPLSPYYKTDLYAPASPRSPQYPPEFQHLRNTSLEGNGDNIEPISRALVHPLAPTPVDDASTRAVSQTSTRKFKASPLSLASTRTDSANQNKRRPSHISIRGQPISQPIASATFQETYPERPIQSPRVYTPGPPPPTPGQTEIASVIGEAEPDWRNGTPLSSVRDMNGPSSSSNNLPFRQFYGDALRSAPPTKTTFLEKRTSILGVHPKTGVPQTPYSPYTPFTPMTPVTPRHLVTREDRKRNKKKEGLKVLSEDDLVRDDEDMWGK
ncbi:hypothetical protein PV10_01291 [Exophiala mesophila]|uniref:Uncharacterized protein n=1 Tax=Exophiala mesophila TaxID=212818 RepID=A0A0D1ZUF8_EXOME|nr:uncharacterized protein PV10_01291 [Exophiala mesophila]KIV97554.1 hypothetical protein PV10_01291 [Exophiala mesophila]